MGQSLIASGLVPKTKSVLIISGGRLPVSECNPALRQVVGGKFHGHPIARQNADTITPQAACQMRQNHSFMFQLYAEQTARKLLEHGAGYFNAIFFAQSNSFLYEFTSGVDVSFDARSEPALNRPALLAELRVPFETIRAIHQPLADP